MTALAPRIAVRKEMIILVVILILAAFAVPAFAQTNTPVPPTATPVPQLEIPTGVLFTETNNWLETFAPIAAIGIGITIALAVLGYLGKLIVQAFRS